MNVTHVHPLQTFFVEVNARNLLVKAKNNIEKDITSRNHDCRKTYIDSLTKELSPDSKRFLTTEIEKETTLLQKIIRTTLTESFAVQSANFSLPISTIQNFGVQDVDQLSEMADRVSKDWKNLIVLSIMEHHESIVFFIKFPK